MHEGIDGFRLFQDRFDGIKWKIQAANLAFDLSAGYFDIIVQAGYNTDRLNIDSKRVSSDDFGSREESGDARRGDAVRKIPATL
jgi:hypothetical protein